MRESEILGMNQRRATSEVLLYKQFQFLNTRLEAYETLLSSPWRMLKAIFNPRWLAIAVNQRQLDLMKAHDEAMRERAQKQKEEAAKPKLTIVGANGIKAIALILCIGLMSGCVSLKRHRREIAQSYKDGYAQADRECFTLQTRIAGYVNSLKERLTKFNQINEDGSLRTKSNDDSKPFDDSPEAVDAR